MSRAGQSSQGLLVLRLQRTTSGFCEQHGEDDPADAGKRARYFHVTLPLLCRLVLGGQRQSGERGAQAVDFAIRPGGWQAVTSSWENTTLRWALAPSMVPAARANILT